MSALFSPQDPNEDTEWNDILRKKGILPPKEEPKDDEEEQLALQQQSVGKRDSFRMIFLVTLKSVYLTVYFHFADVPIKILKVKSNI